MPNGQEVTAGFNKIEAKNEDGKLQGFQRISHSSEKYGFYYIDGHIAFHLSSKARSHGPIGWGRLKDLLNNLHITRNQFQELCQCRMTGSEYHSLMVDKQQQGLLPPDPREYV